MKTKILSIVLIFLFSKAEGQNLGNSDCDSLLLVSSWFNNNVKIFDGCDGGYIRDLAEDNVLRGPQAMFQDANGDVVVVSESNHKLVKFDRETLSQATEVVSPGLMNNPITVAKLTEDRFYMGSYSDNNIIEIDTNSWQSLGTVLPANNNKVRGIDVGMALGPDGSLYVPGYDSDSILKVNPQTGATSQFVPSGKFGMDRPRSILFVNNQMLVTVYGKGKIFAFDLSGGLISDDVVSLPGATALMKDGEGHFLASSDSMNTIRRYNANDFSFETIVSNGSGGLRGATFVYRLEKHVEQLEIENNRQAWVIGVGQVDGDTITVPEMYVSEGGQFGDLFDSDDITNKVWGAVTFRFIDCHTAEMTYQSHAVYQGSSFGNGGYQVQRLAHNGAGLDCQDQGMVNTTDHEWKSGTYLGLENAGEGFMVDVVNGDEAIVTWYTYLPWVGD